MAVLCLAFGIRAANWFIIVLGTVFVSLLAIRLRPGSRRPIPQRFQRTYFTALGLTILVLVPLALGAAEATRRATSSAWAAGLVFFAVLWGGYVLTLWWHRHRSRRRPS